MNEEEKKAVELLENIKDESWTTKYIMSSDSKNAEILLNLIDRLQKENEELKEKRIDPKEYGSMKIRLANSIPKSVIEDKLNELKECNTSCLVEQIYNNEKKALCKELLDNGNK